MRIRLWLPALIAGLSAMPAYAVDCAAWNTTDFNWSGSAVRTCLAAGADIQACGRYDQTSLHREAQESHEAPIRTLLNAGADLEARDEDGETQL